MIVRPKRSLASKIRKIVITALILLLLFVVAGVSYVYLTGRDAAVSTAVQEPAKPVDDDPLPKPIKPSANAPVGAAVNALSTPIKGGTNSSMTVQTNATSKCTIEVVYGGVKSTDSGLGPKVANDYGTVTWTWTVEPTAPVGKWPIKVTCVYNGRSAVVIGDQVIEK